MGTAGKGTLFVYLQAAPLGGGLLGFMCGGLPAPFHSSQRSLRVAAKAASFNSLAHWASASLLPPLAALGSAPLPLLKKAGENLLENFSGFATDYAGPPLIGSGGLVLFVGRRGGKGWWMDRLAGGKFQRSGRGGGRAQRAQSMGGDLLPRPCFGFAGPLGPQNAAAPRRDPTSPSSPSPARLRQPYGDWMGAQKGRSGHAGGGGVWRPGRPCGPPPGLPNKRAGPGAKGPGPALSGRFASCRGLQSSDSLSR